MTNTDPRPLYAEAISWTHGIMAGVDADRLESPTPCTEFDVRTLMSHLVATVERARVIGEGGDFTSIPVLRTGIPDAELATAYGAAAEKTLAVWSDDAVLDRPVTVPWGTVPGRASLWGYLNETLVHGWDLAVATGQPAEADPALAEAVLQVAGTLLPAERRGGPVPFEAPVAPRDDAGPTERLANWSGRAVPSAGVGHHGNTE
ncbi:TIGR03086 family metal-binding protein [Pseudonocardia sp. TRM90224]|uniref:TIGR03086 family metal-binding protein n=1 Tax=Pseudonocardia sp. TRM90224 TaxID=2812678 RepID=UPI001E29FBDA|nr:TIGR03086 family metal-binding protein [Pseudonocardia sp. TRM90224]